MKEFLSLFLCLISLYTAHVAANAPQDTQPVLTVTCDSLGQKKKQCMASVKAFEDATGHKIKVVEAPTGSTNRLAWVQQQLASGTTEIDVFLVDAVWAGLLRNHLEPLDAYVPQSEIDQFHPILITNNTVEGHLMALPLYVDMGLLIYRKDLLEKYKKPVPETWEELEDIAYFIQEKERAAGNEKIWGFAFSGKAFEGLSCNVGEWIRSHKGGEIVDKEGKVVVNSPITIQALDKVSQWVGHISPPGALNYAEEDTRGVFQSGNAVFIRHWPYVIALAEAEESPIAGKIGVAPLPKGGKEGQHAGTLGGWQLAISKYSKNKEMAAQFIRFVTGDKELVARAKRGGYYPPRPHLYNDAIVKKALPYAALIKKALDNAIARPSAQTGLKYNQASAAIWNTAHKILLKQAKASKAIPQLEKQLNFMSKNGKNWHKK